MAHPQEPWTADRAHTTPGCYELSGAAPLDWHFARLYAGPLTEAVTRRIVACVNACRNVPTAELEAGRYVVGPEAETDPVPQEQGATP